jgi:hypothetical protein
MILIAVSTVLSAVIVYINQNCQSAPASTADTKEVPAFFMPKGLASCIFLADAEELDEQKKKRWAIQRALRRQRVLSNTSNYDKHLQSIKLYRQIARYKNTVTDRIIRWIQNDFGVDVEVRYLEKTSIAARSIEKLLSFGKEEEGINFTKQVVPVFIHGYDLLREIHFFFSQAQQLFNGASRDWYFH